MHRLVFELIDNMEYNTSRTKLVYKEYGRNIQKLIDHAVTIEDDEKRNAFAKRIIELMGQINPHLKNTVDFRHKLWDHLFLISDFRLDVESPYPIPTRESLAQKTVKMPYPRTKLRFRHYGKNVEALIAKAIAMEDEGKKKEFTRIIANYMKMVYRSRNEVAINDDIIKHDLKKMSDGALEVDEGLVLKKMSNSRSTGQRDSGSNNKRRKGRSGNTRKHHQNSNKHKRRSYRQHGK